MKVVINACFGGFGLSRAAFLRLREMGNESAKQEADIGEMWSDGSGLRKAFGRDSFLRKIPRADPQLIQVVQEMGEAVNGGCAQLKIVEVPDGVEWEIDEYDGNEHVAEKHRIWS
jgi:hypothetical protein